MDQERATKEVETEGDFYKRECIRMVPTSIDLERCGCGRKATDHSFAENGGSRNSSTITVRDSWSIVRDTKEFPTDAYGLIEFQGGLHPHKAHFLRLSFDSKPADILRLLEQRWKLKLPKLVISIYGSADNFEMPPKLAQVFGKGLVKTIKTTDTWIICNGLDSGLSKYVSAAFASTATKRIKRNAVIIGIAPWGMLKNRADFLFKKASADDCHCVVEKVEVEEGVHVPYHGRRQYHPLSQYGTLSSAFTHFLLVDNGTTHRYGAEIALRRRLEEYIRQQTLIEANWKHVPVVGIVVKGGVVTLRTIMDFVTNIPAIPVVVLDGSGGTADLLGIIDRYTENAGQMSAALKSQIIGRIQTEFNCRRQQQAEWIFEMLMLVARRKKKMHVFRLEGTNHDFDSALLSALLNAQRRMPMADRLALTLTWNRADVASEYVFARKRDLGIAALEGNMMEALIHDRVDFVPLLLANGVSMEKFLTTERLEQLYNKTPKNYPLLSALEDFTQISRNAGYQYTLVDVGAVMTMLMGGVYDAARYRARTVSPLPFNDLFIWAILTKRRSMALCMWKNGPEAMAKALIAIKLSSSLSREASETPDAEAICAEFDRYADEFRRLSLQLLSQCYSTDHELTLQLLTKEMPNWGNETCLSLAVRANHYDFIAHPACQLLLSDLWQGGMRTRSDMTRLVLISLAIPPLIFALDFKTKQELQLQARHTEQPKSTGMAPDVKLDQNIVALPSPPAAVATGPTMGLTCLEKIREFYSAPITKYCLWTLSYLLFLCIYTVFVLVKKQDTLSWDEYFLVAYAFVFGCDLIRELIMSDTRTFMHKFRVFARRRWNMTLMLAVTTLLITALIRSVLSAFTSIAHLFYACNIVVWYIRILDVMGVHHRLGPHIIMFGKTVVSFLYLSTIFAVLVVSHGVAKQSILRPNETEWEMSLLRDAVFSPYFMIFGEVFKDDIDTCGDKTKNCVVGHWITPILQALYFLVVVTILLNILIATVNNVFMSVNESAETIWKFHRHDRITEYELKPLLPPPLTVFSHLIALSRYVICRLRYGESRGINLALKLVLDSRQTKIVLQFEVKSMEEMEKANELAKSKTPAELLARADDLSELVAMKVDDIHTSAIALEDGLQRYATYFHLVERHVYANLGVSTGQH